MRTLSITVLPLLFAHSAFGFRSPSGSIAGIARHVAAPNSSLRARAEAAVEKDDRDDAAAADDDDDAFPSRRRLLGRALYSAVAASVASTDPTVASAKVVAIPSSSTGSNDLSESIPERVALVRAIADKSPDEDILTAINRLVPLGPLKDTTDGAKYASALDGEWKLIWYNTSNFSPLLKLPSPFRPDSYQYFGGVAAREVGEGRVAQGLSGGVLGPSWLWLSSGAVAREGHPSTIEIFPPFRFQLGQAPGSASPKRTIVDADSDADFRKVNARSTEAQLAPKNEYEQLYLENFGSGSLRVSMVTSGDPVIVGEMFVHQKL